MTCYIVVESNVLDPSKLSEYGLLAAPTVAKYGGVFIAKGASQSLHGGNSFANKAIIEFPNEQQARSWYNSTEYKVLLELRDQAMESNFQLVAALQKG